MYKRLAFPLVGALLAVSTLISLAKANRVAAYGQINKAPLSSAANLGTAFSYQGQLIDGGTPANGSFDFRFDLYDSASTDSGNLLGQVDLSSVPVQAGLFTVDLDFGAVFNGSALWLEIWVRASGTGDAFTELEPRQAITPVPFAHYASSAPWSGLSAIPPGFSDGVDDDALGLLNCSAGQITEWNGSSWVCGSDDTGGGDSAWLLSGNSGTTPGVNFLGTIDSTPMELRVANQRAWRLEPGVNSPNIIAGYSLNSAGSGVSGATVSGGGYDLAINQVTADYGVVGGGRGNTASGYAAVVDGGEGNIASSSYAAVGGGSANTTAGNYASLLGGQNNLVYGAYGMIGGGSGNSVTGTFATVPGGALNMAIGNYASIGGGYYNQVEAKFATITGGGPSDLGNPTTTNNRVYDDYGSIGGGGNNVTGSNDGDTSSAEFGIVGGGSNNNAGGSYSTVSGGFGNSASAYGTSVGGGSSNTAGSNYAVVGGGAANSNGGQYGIIAGGNSNSITASRATISGGQGNSVSGAYGTIPGGYGNSVNGNYSFAAGVQASADHQGTFVWSDSTDGFASTGQDQFLIDASGGVGIGTDSPSELLTVGGNAHILGDMSIDENVKIHGGSAITVGLVLSNNTWLDRPSSIFAVGDIIYVTSFSTNTLASFDVSDPQNPVPKGYSTSSLQGPVDVQVMGDRAYIASELNDSLVVMDISNPANPDSLSSANKNLDHPKAVYVSGNYAYVASGGDGGGPDGLAIFEVVDPKEVLLIGFTSTNLDLTSDVYVVGDFAYVTSANNNQLVIFDVSNPKNIIARGFTSDFLNSPVNVHVRGVHAYVISENNDRMVIFNISDPDNIIYVGHAATSLTNPAELFLTGDLAYVTYEGDVITADHCGLAVFDISDPANITTLNVIDMSEWMMWIKGGTIEEPTWEQLPPEPAAVTGNGEHIFIANGNHNTVTIFEVNHLSAPVIKAGMLQAGYLEVTDNALFNNDVNVRGGLNVGPGGVLIEGQLAVSGMDENYIMGALSIGAAGKVFSDTAITQFIYPTHQLDVHGEARFRVNEHNNLVFRSNNAGSDEDGYIDFIHSDQSSVVTPTARIEFDAADPITHTTSLRFYTQGADDIQMLSRLIINSDGNVTPGEDNAYSLGADGIRWTSVYAVNGTIQTSDGRWKDELMNLSYGLEEITQLRPVVFRWTDSPEDGIHYGLIAQEVMEVLPDVVRVGNDPEGTLGMNYSELVPVLVKAIQEQQDELDDQNSQIDALEARLSMLESGKAAHGSAAAANRSWTWLSLCGLLLGGVIFLRCRR